MNRYQKSAELLARAQKSIPLGTQTFSKSKTQYPEGVSPFYIDKGKGSHVWDVDGNEYIDFVNGLGAVTLGYCDPEVEAAVQAQLQQGVTFSLPTVKEIELAESIVETIPCAEMVRFGKNGSDATTAAIRLARAYTGRDKILVGGYHGWHDWYIGSTARHLGVPEATRHLTQKFSFNDLETLKQSLIECPQDYAAIILEPMGAELPQLNFLQGVRELADNYGVILIFDEVVTGYRCREASAQARFGVIPDLAAIGKGIANGYPLSAVVGKAPIMKYAEEVFFSFTFGSEAVSIAAAQAVLDKLKTHSVLEVLHNQGKTLMEGVSALINKYSLQDMLSLAGYESCSTLIFKDTAHYKSWELKTLYLQEVLANGILTLGVHLMSYAHSEADVQKLLKVYDEVFALLKFVNENQELYNYLRCKPIEPLFKIRNN